MKNNKQHYKSIFISDIHLGSRDCKAEVLCSFLKQHSCDNLFLVGDIIDGWKVKQNAWKWQESHTKVVKKILKFSKSGVKVTYVTGNHDSFLRDFIGQFNFRSIAIVDNAEYRSVDGLLLFITHGDMFDGISNLAPWVSKIGDHAYDFLLWINRKFSWVRSKLGLRYWSLSQHLKSKAKGAVNFIFKFKDNMVTYCNNKGYDGVICGHIHTPVISIHKGVLYMNDGDWVETCSALVEHVDGRWEIIYWKEEK